MKLLLIVGLLAQPLVTSEPGVAQMVEKYMHGRLDLYTQIMVAEVCEDDGVSAPRP